MFAETANGELTPSATQIIRMGQFSSSDACLQDGKSWTGFMFFWNGSRESSNEFSPPTKRSEFS